MASYCTQYSFTFGKGLSTQQHADAVIVYDAISDHEQNGKGISGAIPTHMQKHLPAIMEFCDSLGDYGFGFGFKDEPDGIWIYDNDSNNLIGAGLFVSLLLDLFESDEVVGFEYAHTCSRPLLDAFGGGYMLVTRKYSRCQDSSGLLFDAVKKAERVIKRRKQRKLAA